MTLGAMTTKLAILFAAGMTACAASTTDEPIAPIALAEREAELEPTLIGGASAPDRLGAALLPSAERPLVVSTTAPRWVRAVGDTGSDAFMGTATDGAGNVVATGWFQGSINFGCGTLTGSGTSYAMFVVKLSAATSACMWSRALVATSDVSGMGIAVSSANDVFVTGTFQGSIAVPALTSSAGSPDGFLLRYDGNGNLIWSRVLGGIGEDYTYGVAIRGASSVHVGGAFTGSVDFGGGVRTSNAGSTDAFVAQYAASNGAFQWVATSGGPGYDATNAVAVDTNNGVWTTGSFEQTATIAGRPQTSAGLTDVFLGWHSATGGDVNSWRIGGAGYDSGLGVAINGFGGRLVGYFDKSIQFPSTTLTGVGKYTAFVAGYNSSQGFIWAHALDAASESIAEGVTIDASGNTYAVGRMSGVGSGGLAGLTSVGTADMFLARYNATGTQTWNRSMGGVGTTDAVAVSLGGPANAVTVGGFFGQSASCGGGSAVQLGSGATQALLCTYNP